MEIYSAKSYVKEVLISEAQIKNKVAMLGSQITNDYKESGENLVLVAALKGSVVFLVDLMRNIDLPYIIDFMSLSSYGSSTVSSGNINIKLDLEMNISDKDILIVEDIVDTGLTLVKMIEMLDSRKPRSIKVCSLLTKRECNQSGLHPDYFGFDIPDVFVVGYGLDYAEKFRGLPYIGVLNV
jgi:hypoxanthine phosphoribosyltransferase